MWAALNCSALFGTVLEEEWAEGWEGPWDWGVKEEDVRSYRGKDDELSGETLVLINPKWWTEQKKNLSLK